MIPLTLSLSGFLSYREPIEIDFTGFELACISGPNGAGKSSLLDAITWALFGQARKRDDSLINTQSAAAEVSLVFAYEGNIYRVQRAKPRDKTTVLEFHILLDEGRKANDNSPSSLPNSPSAIGHRLSTGAWKPLTERTLRETEQRIQETLRLDYETFVNASFFLQGKADQFTQQRPGDRKRILSSILGLEIWESYRQRAAENRRQVEGEITELDGRLREIINELDEEEQRKNHLAELEAELESRTQARKNQEVIVNNYRQFRATLKEQEKLVDALLRQVEAAEQGLEALKTRLASRRLERDSYVELLERAEQVEANYTEWGELQAELERWEADAARFREHEGRRHEPRTQIETARARLEQELLTLQTRREALQATEVEIGELRPQAEAAQAELAQIEALLQRKTALEDKLHQARQRLAEARAENPRLYAEMHELKSRIDQLKATDSAECPLCGQPLVPADRERLIVSLEAQGGEMGDRYRANQELLKNADQQVNELESQIAEFVETQEQFNQCNQNLASLTSRLELLEGQVAEWHDVGALRLAEIETALVEESYAAEARAILAEIDAELKEIGYDAAAHDEVRRREMDARASQEEMRTLENARAALTPLEREIGGMESQAVSQEESLARQRQEHADAHAALEDARAQAPDPERAEDELLKLQEQENHLRLEVGAARQKVEVLNDLKARRAGFEAQREALAAQAGRYKRLERAFGKDGVPALLIEQALPEIETKANEVLERLSAGAMSVRFITQAQYKDKKREDLKETLDIQISDSVGQRDYEMFSGGEAFRVNFAIRLALSEVLAQRAGARLQTLVIDEGFGSQDALGRQRLVEAINMVRADFAKILVITHIDELKDAFPNRIEVEKTDRGSIINVV